MKNILICSVDAFGALDVKSSERVDSLKQVGDLVKTLAGGSSVGEPKVQIHRSPDVDVEAAMAFGRPWNNYGVTWGVAMTPQDAGKQQWDLVIMVRWFGGHLLPFFTATTIVPSSS